MTLHCARAARILLAACLLIHFGGIHVHAQPGGDTLAHEDHISRLMERTDLTFEEVNARAERYFARYGTGRGSGYKQYQRWKYERQFHLDANRMYIEPGRESSRYAAFMRSFEGQERTTEPWSSLGPETWNNTSGWNPGIGRITSVAVLPSNDQIIYVSSPGGGIWKSSNGGNTWTPLIDELNAAWMFIYNLALDPGNANTLYAAVMNPGGGVIKTTNAGVTWTATGGGPSNTRKVLVHPANSNIVFATAANGIWRSSNGGTSWTQVHPDTAEDIEFKPGDPNVVYSSGTANTLKRSTDNGVSWTAIGAGAGITHYGRTLLAVSPDNPSVVYAVQSHPNLTRFGRLYKSTNSGVSFTTTVIGDPASGTNFFGYEPTGTDTIGQAWHDMAMCVNPVNADEVHIAGIICWKSTDGGFTFFPETEWSYPNNTGYNHADVHALEYVNGVLYAGTDGGIYKSLNQGNDWTDLSAGLGIRQIYRMSQAKTDAHRIVIGAQDNGTSFRQTNGTWWDWLGADGMDNAVSPTAPNTAFGMWQFGALNKTTNGGQTRTYLGQPSDGNWITPLVMHPANHDILFGGWTGIYKSENGGNSWTLLSGTTINARLNTLAVAPSNTNYIYGSVDNILYRTSDGGSTWSSVTLPANISSIFVSATQPEKIWVTLIATSNHVQVSTNMGTTFTSIAGNLPSLAGRTVVVNEDDPDGNGVYVGLNVGVYYRSDSAPDWVPFGTDLPLVAVNELEIHEATGKIRVATYGRGVWENQLVNGGGGGECTEYAYVPNAVSNNVSVVELNGNTVVTTIPVGTYPTSVCHSSDGAFVYVTNRFSDNLSVIETATQSVIATVPLGANSEPDGVAITPDDSMVFTANYNNGTVSVIQTGTNTVLQSINVGGQPTSVQVMPDGSKVYVSDYQLNRIIVINAATLAVENTIPLPSLGADLKFTPDGTLAFVMNSLEDIYVIQTASETVIETISFPSGYLGTSLCVAPDGQTLYAGFFEDSPGPTLGIVDIPTLSITGYATGICCGIGGISMSGDGAHLYATHPGNNQVTQVATSTHAAVTTFNVGTWPIGRGDFVIDCSEPGGPVDVCGTTHYDSGGPTGNYGNSEDVVETLCPNDPYDKVILHFMAFELESGYDFLKIYDGETTNDPPLHTGEGFSGSLSPGSLYATQPSGCLTLHFTSDATINLAGWAAEVECAPVDCGTTNYDSGGPTGHYGNNEDSTMTFCPVLDGDKVEMTFMAFDLENGWDFLKIYDGPTTGAPALHSGQGFTGTIIPGPFISTHETGCLTIRFTSDGSFTRPGWEAAIECRPIVCDTDFFDSGGPGGEYANNESSTTILCPDQPGEYIELEFLSFALEEGFDFLQVFDGLATTDPPLHPGNGFTGSTLPGTLVSSHPSGCLTAHFTSDGSVTMEGWAAHVNCREPSACGTILSGRASVRKGTSPRRIRTVARSGTNRIIEKTAKAEKAPRQNHARIRQSTCRRHNHARQTLPDACATPWKAMAGATSMPEPIRMASRMMPPAMPKTPDTKEVRMTDAPRPAGISSDDHSTAAA